MRKFKRFILIYMKMVGISTFLFVILSASTSANEINYCGSKMCGYTGAHTFCQFASGPSSDCTGYIPAPLNAEETTRILTRLNRRRDDAASGKMRGLPSAGNMLKLRWVGELAREAQLWADQCRPPQVPEEHDACRDLYSITVGQCVASVVGEAPGLRVESMVDIWYMQSTYYKGNVTLYEPFSLPNWYATSIAALNLVGKPQGVDWKSDLPYPMSQLPSDEEKHSHKPWLPESSKRYYGDFAQMMWARTYMVGCGRSRFMVQVRGRYRTVERLVCNFAPLGPPLYRPLWMPGVPATTCPSRSRSENILTSSLCDYQQGLNQLNDEDNSMSVEEHILLNTVLEMEKNETQYKGSLDEIYLTYLAIVTMQNSVQKTEHSNSIQKRDVVEKLSIENADRNTNSGKSSELGKFLNETIELHTVQVKLKKKLKTIGRPRAYNMEELSDIGGDQTDENHDTTEAVSKDKKKFYEDYTMDFTEEKVTETNEQIDIKKNVQLLPHTMIQNHDLEQHLDPLARTFVANNASIENLNYAVMPMEGTSRIALPDEIIFDKITNENEAVQSTETHSTIYNDYTTKNDSMAAKDKTMDDYLSDPETVRQLQEALNRMERVSNASKSSGKTRRDLREVQSDHLLEAKGLTLYTNHVTILPGNDITSTVSPEDERNISVERAPMLNMVMKYMPYLKSYENEILGTQSSANGPFLSGWILYSLTLVWFCLSLCL